jgi:acyl-CoA synthetase (AMP-forming)/AMP-acid ligase II
MPLYPQRLGDLPDFAASQWPDSEALSFGDDSLNFQQLRDQIALAAHALLARGIGKGECVGLWITNRIEFVIAFYAVVKIGAVAVPLNTRYRSDAIRFVVAHAECRMLIIVERSGPVNYLALLQAAVPGFHGRSFGGSPEFPLLRDIVVICDDNSDVACSWNRLLADANAVQTDQYTAAAAAVQQTDTALIVFTSGTTGNPKGVVHDHSNIRAVYERALSWPLRHGDSVLEFLPMFHLYALSEMVIACMVTGVHQVIMDAFDPELALRLIDQKRVSGLHGFETHYADLLRAHDKLKTNISSLRFGTLPAGSENSNAVAEQVQERLCPTVTGFGMSETWAWACLTTLEDGREQRCTTSGRPMPGMEIRIIDPDTGQDLPQDNAGEILCRGYGNMRGYFRDPETTARTIDSDGWLHSGDQGLLRPDGYLRFLGRYKEMLKVGGENVSPAAVEQELLRLVPGIEQVAVVPYPDERLTEVPVAYIVAQPETVCTLEEVQARCRGRIASFKIPRYVVTVESLPMTPSGKVQRAVLKARALVDISAA